MNNGILRSERMATSRWLCRQPVVPERTCHGGKQLVQFRRPYKTPRSGVDKEGLMRCRASKTDCDICPLKQQCCSKEPARKVLRSIHEGARNMARDITKTDAYVTASYA